MKGRSAGLAKHGNGMAAVRARQRISPIDGTSELKAAGPAVTVHVVADGTAAGCNRFGEGCTDGGGQRVATRATDPAGGAGWRDAGTEQTLSRIDVADADDAVAVHQEGFDRGLSAAGGCIEPVAVKSLAQWFDAEHGEQRVGFNAGPLVLNQGAETTWVAQAQHDVGEDEVDVVVCLRRGADWDET